MQRDRIAVLISFLLFVLTGCPSGPEGILQGSVVRPSPGVRLSVEEGGKVVSEVTFTSGAGAFRIPLSAGSYEVRVATRSSTGSVVLSGIRVRSGETTNLAPITVAPEEHGSGTVAGTVRPPGIAARVSLFRDGTERASVAAARSGRFRFRRLPAGHYTIKASAAGYSCDSAEVEVSGNRTTKEVFRLLYMTDIDGIDWTAGMVRARGVGHPSWQAPTPAIRHAMAKEAAVADAERNLLNIVGQIRLGPDTRLSETLRTGAAAAKLQGFLREYRIVADRELNAGKVEVELELPLTGPDGLSSLLASP